jgi:3-dehydroquinate dehydratase-1
MIVRLRTKMKPPCPGRVVAVIASRADLAKAVRLRRLPDCFELRLDMLRNSLGEVSRIVSRLRAPLILTARDPREGGAVGLTLSARRALLLQFLDQATMVDLELRSVRRLEPLLREIRSRRLGLILSHHDLRTTPTPTRLCELIASAVPFHPAVFKLATRTDTPEQVARLVSFFRKTNSRRLPLAAMGMGKLGFASRRQLDRLGSALTYVSLGQPNTEGQPTLSRLTRARHTYNQ